MEIQNDVKPPPTFFKEEPVKKGRAKAAPKPIDHVLENLKLLGLIVKKSGSVQETFVNINNGFATACIGELTIGCPFPWNIDAVVNFRDLLEAKKVAGDEFACTVLNEQLVVVADDVRMMINVSHANNWQAPRPDNAIAPATDELRRALADVAPFSSSDRGDIVGILCQAYTTVGTNGHAMLESWHGVDMPPNIRVPVSFVKKLVRIKRKIISFGYSECSLTLWFEDGAFIRTALHPGEYANYSKAFTDTVEFDIVDLPEEFYKTLKSIAAFAKDGVVYFKDGRIYTAKQVESASSFEHKAIPNGFGFNINYLLLIAPHAPTVKFLHSCEKIQFECGNVRGAVMGLDLRPPQQIAKPQEDSQYNDTWEDDIPF